MKHRLLESIARIADAISRRCREMKFRDTMRRRNEDGAHFVGAVVTMLVTVGALTLQGCVPQGGASAVVGAVVAAALAVFSLVVLFASHVDIVGYVSQRDRDVGKLMTAAILALACVTIYGCHGAERATRTALDVTAHAVDTADAIVAREYADAAHRELDAATDLDDYHRRMRRWDRAEAALRAVVQALYAAEAALDAAGATGARGVLACVYTAAVDLVGALSALDVPIPQALSRAVDTLGAFVGECHPPQAASQTGATP